MTMGDFAEADNRGRKREDEGNYLGYFQRAKNMPVTQRWKGRRKGRGAVTNTSFLFTF
jgi:hypothetical protein